MKSNHKKDPEDRVDYTEQYRKGSTEAIRLMNLYGAKKYYGVADSPMCGPGYGILARDLESIGYKVLIL